MYYTKRLFRVYNRHRSLGGMCPKNSPQGYYGLFWAWYPFALKAQVKGGLSYDYHKSNHYQRSGTQGPC